MSVIAKFYIDGRDQFADGTLLSLSATAENKLMAQYAPENEDVLFSKASPWGSCRIQCAGAPNVMLSDKLYLIFVKATEANTEKALGFSPVRIASITDFGGTSKQVEITNASRDARVPLADRQLRGFTMRIGIDNPGASRQFVAGEAGWTVLVYRCADLSMDDALAIAHKPLPGADGAAAEAELEPEVAA